ncbi:hypothetical protein OAU02_02040, partial [Candidatus Pseudothioglobus singularis]|nr:hypothetical protein [Candidatus Pseudothioglobus singularis]
KEEDLEKAWNESSRWSEKKSLLVESFESGLQISSESFLLSGKAFTPALSERNYSRLDEFRPFIIEDGGTIPPLISEDLVEKINRLIEDGAKAMGVIDGIVKGDIVIDKTGNPLIVELALRLSGGWFASDQIIAATGVDLVKVVMNQSLGIHVSNEDLQPIRKKSTSIRYWFPQPGKITNINGVEKLNNIPGLLKYGFFRVSGDVQPQIRSHSDRFGYVIVEGKDRTETISRVEQAIKSLDITMTAS